MTAPQLLTLAQAGERLGVSYWTARRLVEAGQLRVVKVGRCTRIREDELARFIDRQTAA